MCMLKWEDNLYIVLSLCLTLSPLRTGRWVIIKLLPLPELNKRKGRAAEKYSCNLVGESFHDLGGESR